MNKFVKTLYGAGSVLLASMATPLMAASSDFAGLFLGIYSSAIGVELEGDHNDNQSNVTTGAIGKFALIGGAEAGYSFPLGDKLLIDIGISVMPGGAKITSDNALSSDVSFEISDHVTYYIQPKIAISDTSAIYLKLGQSDADTTVSGDVNKPDNISGNLFAIGTQTIFPNGKVYLKTEAGFTDYDQIKVTGKGSTGGVSTGTTVTADPTIAFGTVSLGIRF